MLFIFTVYPWPLVSVRFRDSVFKETGHTIRICLQYVFTFKPSSIETDSYTLQCIDCLKMCTGVQMFGVGKIFFFMLNSYKYYIDAKLHFQQPSFQSSVSHDPSEIILICWFAAQETFLIIIQYWKQLCCVYIFVELIHFNFLGLLMNRK